jgi:hypothetical protein
MSTKVPGWALKHAHTSRCILTYIMVILWAEANPGQAGDKQRSEGLNAIMACVHWVRKIPQWRANA